MSENESRTDCILVVDDDVPLRDLLVRYLGQNGFQTQIAGDCRQAEQVLDRHHIDAIVLDLMLPGEDGLSFCRRLRGQGVETPILMLTARGDDVDRIVGLEIGADDYLPKPGNPRELLARLRAILRRSRGAAIGAPRPELGEARFGECHLDHASRTLSRGDEARRLTSGEYALLTVFLRHPNQPLSRDRLLSLARGREHEPYERSIDVMVSRLRRLIEADPKQPRHLQTVWGSGYVFVPE